MKSLLKKISISFLCGLAFITPTVFAAYFPDVDSSQWFYQDVQNMAEWDVIRGNSDGTFAPERNINRAELSAMWNRYHQNKVRPIEEELFDLRVNILNASAIEIIDENQDTCDFALTVINTTYKDSYYQLLDEAKTMEYSLGESRVYGAMKVLNTAYSFSCSGGEIFQ